MSIVENADDAHQDVVWGAQAIAAVWRANERRTFRLLATGMLPATKVGGRWVASRRKLLEAIIGEPAA